MPAWLIWAVVALFSWGVWALLSRLLGAALSAEQSQALSTLGLIPILIPLWLAARGQSRNRAWRKGMGLALGGGLVSCLGNVPYYAAVAKGDHFAAVVSLTALAPVITVLLALVILRERLNALQWAGLALAVTAIWLFNISDTAGFLSPVVVVALPPIVLWGLSGFFQKVATNHINAELAAFVYLGAFIPLGVFYALREPIPADIAPRTWALVIALGFLLAFGNYAVITAYARRGKAAVIAPVVNLYPIVSISIGVLMGDRLSAREIGGMLVAIAAVVALSWESAAPQSVEVSS